MQTEILERQDVSAKFKVEVPAAEVDKAYGTILRSLARQVKVPGFRPGKAPRGVIEARVGKDAVAQEVRDALVETYYPQAAQELDLAPVSANFHAYEPVEGEDYSFEVEVELYPEVKLPNIQDIVIDTSSDPITDEMVAETIENLQSENATLVPVERPAEAGDYLTVESLGETAGSTMPIDLERVGDALAEQFYGKSIGDEVALKLDVPTPPEIEDDEEVAAEAGEVETAEEDTEEDVTEASTETAEEPSEEEVENEPLTVLNVVIRDIKAKEKPEPDDEFAKTLGFDTWEEAETQIRRSLQAQLDQETFSEQQEEFIDKLVEETELSLPQSLVNRRKRNLLENLAQDLQGRGMNMQMYLESLEADDKRQAFEDELDEAAATGVKRDLVLEKLLEKRGTQITTEELDAALTFMAQRQQSTVVKLRQELGREGVENYRFLLSRDKAVRESLRELLGEDEEVSETVDAESNEDPSAEADVNTDTDTRVETDVDASADPNTETDDNAEPRTAESAE